MVTGGSLRETEIELWSLEPTGVRTAMEESSSGVERNTRSMVLDLELVILVGSETT